MKTLKAVSMKTLKTVLGLFLFGLGMTFLLIPGASASVSFSYPTPNYYEVGRAITPLSPSISGSGYTFSVSPVLPSGLSIDVSTGVISGTSSVLSLAKNYTVTASSEAGNQTATLSLATLFRPVTFYYDNNVNFLTINRPIVPAISPSVSQNGVLYSISPDLPDGISLDTASGVISGFPTEVSSLSSYVVTSQNPLGLATTSLAIAVPLPWARLGSDIANSGAAAPSLNFDYLQSSSVPYVVYNNTSDGSLKVVKYSAASSSWNAVGSAIASTTATQGKIVFSSDHTPYISYLNDGSVFIRKYSSAANAWNSLSSGYNSDGEESGSALSNEATSHDLAVNLSGDAYEAYIASNILEIVKLVDNQAEYSAIDNLEYPTIPSNLSYGTSSLVFGSGSRINYLPPSVSGKPTYFTSSPGLPLGLSLGNSNKNSGMIFGTPLFGNDENEYVITAKNSLGSATTSLRIKTEGPWKDLSANIFARERFLSGIDVEKSASGDFYFSYFSPLPNKLVEGNYMIKKYESSTGTWENIMVAGQTKVDVANYQIDADIVQAIATAGDDLYALMFDALVDFSDLEIPQSSVVSRLKKYDANTGSWTTLGEFDPIGDPIFSGMSVKIAVSGSDVFLASYTEDGAISVFQFDPETGGIMPGTSDNGGLADFYPSHINNNDQLVAADDSRLYVAYTDTSVSDGDVVVNVFDKASGEWTPYTDSLATVNLVGTLNSFALNSFKLDASGNPYFSFSYTGSYCDVSGVSLDKYGQEVCSDSEERTVYHEYSAVKRLNLSGDGSFSNLSLEDVDQKDIISFDHNGVLWSSTGNFDNKGYKIRSYVDGAWVDAFPSRQLTNSIDNVYYPELFFDADNDLYAFSRRAPSVFFAKYEGTEAPLNYDYSVAPTISYPSASVTYVTGRSIDNLYPSITGSISEDVSCLNPNGGGCYFPSGLYSQRGSVYGTPLIATSTVWRFKAINSAGSSTFDVAVNIVDPWVELGDPLSASAQAVSLAVDSNNKLWAAYSESSGDSNEIYARKYDNESWGLMGGLVSDSGISASHPKIVSYLSNVYIAYREDSTGKLWVKKYNSQSGVWEVLGGAVTNYSSEYFDIDPAYSNGVSVIYYDDVSDHSVVKTFRNDYWEITGGYLEGGQYPSLSSADDKIYASYSTSAGRLSVENYEGFNSSSTGKEVPLANIGNLVAAGDMSPQGGLSATSTPAVKFNQRINLIPFAGASVVISAGTIMTANENFDSSLLTATSTVDLTGIASSLTPKGVLMFGLPNLGLSLSSPITISIPISGVAENTQLQVYSKTAGSSWSPLTTCYVVAGKCSFQTTHLSEFAAGTVVSSSSGSSGGGGSAPVVADCTSVSYGDFAAACFGGYQYRGVISRYPANCSLTSAQIEASRRPCQLDGGVSSGEGGLGSIDGGEYPAASSSKPVAIASSSASTTPVTVISALWSEIRAKFIAAEKALTKKVNKVLARRLSGRILLQVEDRGQAWYINPTDGLKYFLGRPEDAFALMRKLALGIDNKTFDSFKGKAPAKLSGRILLKVEDSGKAYYINPRDLKLHYLGRPADAFNLMRNLGLGAKNSDIRQIMIGD